MNTEYYVYNDRNSYRIPVKFKDQFFYKKIKKELTIAQRDYFSKEIVRTEYFYETEKALLIPRLFPVNEFFQQDKISPKEKYIAKKIKLNSKVQPRNKIQTDSIEYLLLHPNVLLQLPPGSGKTVITIDVICKLRFKTIIYIHRDSLLNQWHERLIDFSDITESQIGVLNSSTYKEVLKDSDIILCTVQSFNACLRNENIKRDFLKHLYFSGIGLMIGDEVHTTVGAPKFSIASILTPCHRTIGLSATPDRNDGTFDIMKYHLGEIYESPYSSGTMDAEVHVILFDFELLNGRKNWLFWQGQFQFSRYYQILRKSTKFMNILENIIHDCINSNRHIVVMMERLKLINDFMNIFKDFDCTTFTAKDKNNVLTHKIVFTTPGKMRDGVDAPWKDTIILTTPISNINQAIGRIIRQYDNKKTPIVYDFVDTGISHIYSSFFKKRLPFYIKKNWNVKYYVFKNGKLELMNQDQAFRISGFKK